MPGGMSTLGVDLSTEAGGLSVYTLLFYRHDQIRKKVLLILLFQTLLGCLKSGMCR